MTAVVAILNKNAVVMAADSAVTIDTSHGHKVLNKANKLFRLSDKSPVGLMLYNNASFMGTPWELIIRMYKTQLGVRSFDKLEDYVVDFLGYLKSNDYFNPVQDGVVFIKELALNIFNSFAQKVTSEIDDSKLPSNIEQFIFTNIYDKLNIANEELKNVETCIEYVDLDFSIFQNETKTIFEDLRDNYIADNIGDKNPFINLLQQYVFNIIRSKAENLNAYSGLVFTGYGNTQFFPSLVSLKVWFAYNGRLKYVIENEMNAEVNHDNQAYIRPFAQTDVIDTILRGSSFEVDILYRDIFNRTITSYGTILGQALQQNIPTSEVDYASIIDQIDTKPFIDLLRDEIKDAVKNQFINPLMETISYLSKEDLAEMAESLIYLTYLKRRITSEEESVGGPVDVAVVSKVDGFIWMKRKLYFDPKLNHHYFS